MDINGEITDESAEADAKILLTVIMDQEMLNRLAAHRFAAQSLNEELYDVGAHLDKILLALEQELENTDSH